MADAAKVQRLLDEARRLTPLTPEWDAKCVEIEAALGLTPPVSMPEGETDE